MSEYMQRAFLLTEYGLGETRPNPIVGCVVVYADKIIGEGWHKKYGESHAEVNAIESVRDKSLLSESTVFVTLEPCSHFGKTPPCADLLIKHRVKKVVVANLDPNPLVAGKGIEKLRNAGIDVEIGLLAGLGRWLNRRFFTFIEKKRPYIVLKWAQTADGFVANADGSPVAISNDFSKQWVHRWRAEEAAILVGTNTAQNDNPRLTVRDWVGKNPIRIVLDRHLRLAQNLHLFDGETETLIYNQLIFSNQAVLTKHILIDFEEAVFPQIFRDLHERNIQSVLIEGGTKTLQTLLDTQLFDEIRISKSRKTLGTGIKAPQMPNLALHERSNIAGDSLEVYLKG